MQSDHSPAPAAGPGTRTVTARTPAGPVALGVGSAREAVALVLTIARHWPQWPGAVIGPAGTDRGPIESATGSTGSPDRADRKHRDTDREQHRESDREHPLPRVDRSRTTRAIPRPAA